MTAAYRTDPAIASLFDSADAQYAAIKTRLLSEELLASTEPHIERVLEVEQRELMRRLMQAHVTLRGQEVAAGPVVGADGRERTHVRAGKERGLETVFGSVEVERTGYAGRGLSTLYPVDAGLNLPPNRYSLEVERQTALLAARTSFDATLDTLSKLTGAHVPKRQAEQIVQRAASDFDDFYEWTQLDPSLSTSDLLVLSVDQKGVVLRTEDLTDATRKVAESKRNKMETRGSKGEPKRGRKRMSTVAAVYTVGPCVRTAEDVIAGLRHIRDAEAPKRPRPEGKRVWASLERRPEDVVRDIFAEASLRDPERRKHWVFLLDGDSKLERWVRAEARSKGVQVTLVLDFIHALEYLWRAAHVFFEEDSPDIEAWVLERLKRLLRGEVSKVVAGMTRMATVRKLTKKQRAPVDTAAKYLLRRKSMVQYDKMLAIGAPIASGIIEGACRHLVNDRLDVTGARWSLAGAEAVLRLRSLLASGDFDEYWHIHEEAEAIRNHVARYADEHVPPTTRPARIPHLRLVGAVD